MDLAYNYDSYRYYEYGRDYSASTELSAAAIVLIVIIWLLILACAVMAIIGLWKIFAKAGRNGWESLVPGHNTFVLCEIVGRPTWWVLLTFVPFANLVIMVILSLDIAKVFGKSVGFGVLNIFFPAVMFPILGFGQAQYLGPVAGEAGYGPAPQPQPAAAPVATTATKSTAAKAPRKTAAKK